jgi:16S rRNA G966 N2-methylase RsmD
MDKLVRVRDKVLDRAALKQGEKLLDVGAGEGWIGFGAFGRGAGEVVFSDISTDVLDACREAAEELGVADSATTSRRPRTTSRHSKTQASTLSLRARADLCR